MSLGEWTDTARANDIPDDAFLGLAGAVTVKVDEADQEDGPELAKANVIDHAERVEQEDHAYDDQHDAQGDSGLRRGRRMVVG